MIRVLSEPPQRELRVFGPAQTFEGWSDLLHQKKIQNAYSLLEKEDLSYLDSRHHQKNWDN